MSAHTKQQLAFSRQHIQIQVWVGGDSCGCCVQIPSMNQSDHKVLDCFAYVVWLFHLTQHSQLPPASLAAALSEFVLLCAEC